MSESNDDEEVLYALGMALEHDERHQALALRTWFPTMSQGRCEAPRRRARDRRASRAVKPLWASGVCWTAWRSRQFKGMSTGGFARC